MAFCNILGIRNRNALVSIQCDTGTIVIQTSLRFGWWNQGGIGREDDAQDAANALRTHKLHLAACSARLQVRLSNPVGVSGSLHTNSTRPTI